jgi:CheY-like chemotaxis protein
MFFQIETTLERSHGGLGIGLWLVRRLVELHGGSVEARSEGLNKGSEFIVRLPILVEQSQVQSLEGSRPMEKPAATGYRIVVVDDNHDSAESLAMLLRLSGNEVHTAHDGLEGVRVVEEVRPQVALLDIGMPKLNGYEACRRIREQPWGKDLVLIALTGWGQEEDRRRTEEAGFDAHTVKPVDHSTLMNLLAKLLAKRTADGPPT